MKINRIWIYSLTVMGFVVILTNSCKKDEQASKKTPVITWANPADIIYGTLLGSTQLNATADVAGAFVYTPATGTKLNAGVNQVLKVVFTPTDASVNDTTSKMVKINVVAKKTPVITWANPADINYGTLLSATQLCATADVPGTFVYTPATGTKLNAGASQVLKVVFTPTDASANDTISKMVKINVVAKKTPVITWANPADINYGTLLSATQLCATADVPGTFVYTPATGTKLNLGANQVLNVAFTPTDAVSNDIASKSVKINVILTIGVSYQGGKVAYILQVGDPGYVAGETHGIIAAPSDQSTGIQWYNGSYTITGATAKVLGAGHGNTNTIVVSQGAGNYAAKLCADLDLGGFTDWYLPSIDELGQLFINRVAIGGFAGLNYWSSTEKNDQFAWMQPFNTGYQNTYNKNNTFFVRAIRSF